MGPKITILVALFVLVLGVYGAGDFVSEEIIKNDQESAYYVTLVVLAFFMVAGIYLLYATHNQLNQIEKLTGVRMTYEDYSMEFDPVRSFVVGVIIGILLAMIVETIFQYLL